ncbi:MAG: phosphatase PAP2 family protein [Coxiellaceae bacterium]|nr:phosphatase PAP2 family protein [Coxiellaceae bacterium]
MKRFYTLFMPLTLITFTTMSPATIQPRSIHYLLTEQTTPNLINILPAPPKETDAAFAADKDAYKLGYSHKDSKRWETARLDSLLDYKDITDVIPLTKRFNTAFGTTISPKTTPYTYRIIQEIVRDQHLFTTPVKKHYQRQRPFVRYHHSTCNSIDEPYLITDGSFPSGHTTLGWATALALTEINPKRSVEILQRGYDYGESRIICGAHWQSDVQAGRLAGSIMIARLNAEPTFRDWVTAAQKEIATNVTG